MDIHQDIGETFITDLTFCDQVIDYFENFKGGKRVTGSKKSRESHSLNTTIKTEEHVKGRNCLDMSVDFDSADDKDIQLFAPFLKELKVKFQEYESKVNSSCWPVILLESFNIQKYIPPFGVYSRVHYEHSFES